MNKNYTKNWEREFFKYSRWIVVTCLAYLVIMLIIAHITTDSVNQTDNKPECACCTENWIDCLLMPLEVDDSTKFDRPSSGFDEPKTCWEKTYDVLKKIGTTDSPKKNESDSLIVYKLTVK